MSADREIPAGHAELADTAASNIRRTTTLIKNGFRLRERETKVSDISTEVFVTRLNDVVVLVRQYVSPVQLGAQRIDLGPREARLIAEALVRVADEISHPTVTETPEVDGGTPHADMQPAATSASAPASEGVLSRTDEGRS